MMLRHSLQSNVIIVSMGKIQILPENISNQIAAGEVVERPASVVKELVENAIDAEATRIEIYVEDGGKKKIRIVDNGEGIDKEDIPVVFKRHATSKIRNEDDLYHIQTMGFRGEALSSIASVSKINLKTKPRGSNQASEVIIEAGKLVTSKPVGMPGGTDITVADLFFNVPARRKFLKTTRTEQKHIVDQFINSALANPTIGFSLTHNNREIYALPAEQLLPERIAALLGNACLQEMQELAFEHPHLQISGWINKPGHGQTSARNQYLYVNGRHVKNRTVFGAIKRGFGSTLGRGEYPQFLIFIEIPPDMVDVNVHPRKEEVRFVNESMIFNLVRQMIEKNIPRIESDSWDHISPSQKTRLAVREPQQTPPSNDLAKSSPPTIEITTEEFWRKRPYKTATRNDGPTYPPSQSTWLGGDLEMEVPTLQVQNLYLIRENPNGGIDIYDQHATHERILYEQFVKNFLQAKSEADSQQLLVPATKALSAPDFETLMSSRKILQKVGFKIEDFGNNTVKVSATPASLVERNLDQLLDEFVGDLRENEDVAEPERTLNHVDRQTHRVLSYLACRGAVKAGDRLNKFQIQELLRQLTKTHTNHTCPHGRPVKVTLTEKELRKLFRR